VVAGVLWRGARLGLQAKKRPEKFRPGWAGDAYFFLRGLFIQLAITKKHSSPKSSIAGVADFIFSP
jgi:hypothetical protein